MALGRAFRAGLVAALAAIVPSQALAVDAMNPDIDRAQLVALEMFGSQPVRTAARIDPKEKECLAMALYHEARGEPVAGQEAVGQVILNRVDSRYHPDTVCEVVYKNAHRKNACQFSFACDGISDRPKETKAWKKKVRMARELLSCDEACREEQRANGGIVASTHYHATYVSPRWARKLERTGQIGNHIFYYTATI